MQNVTVIEPVFSVYATENAEKVTAFVQKNRKNGQEGCGSKMRMVQYNV